MTDGLSGMNGESRCIPKMDRHIFRLTERGKMNVNFYLHAKVPNGSGGFAKVRIAHLGRAEKLRLCSLLILIHTILGSMDRDRE